MNFNESTVEKAALEWFPLRQGYGGQVGEQGYALGHGPEMAPGEAEAERENGTNIEPHSAELRGAGNRTPNIEPRREGGAEKGGAR